MNDSPTTPWQNLRDQADKKAYARKLDLPCYHLGCTSHAAWEVVDKTDFIVGRFCRHHSGIKVHELNGVDGSLP